MAARQSRQWPCGPRPGPAGETDGHGPTRPSRTPHVMVTHYSLTATAILATGKTGAVWRAVHTARRAVRVTSGIATLNGVRAAFSGLITGVGRCAIVVVTGKHWRRALARTQHNTDAIAEDAVIAIVRPTLCHARQRDQAQGGKGKGKKLCHWSCLRERERERSEREREENVNGVGQNISLFSLFPPASTLFRVILKSLVCAAGAYHMFSIHARKR